MIRFLHWKAFSKFNAALFRRQFTSVIPAETPTSSSRMMKKPRSNPTSLKRDIDAIQSQNPNHILLIQVGMFYEIYDCAHYLDEIAELLGLRIAQHKNVQSNTEHRYTKFAGFPVHQLRNYLSVLIKNGKTVGIVDQYISNSGTDIIKRKITRILTPGTILNDEIDGVDATNNFLLSIFVDEGAKRLGLAWVDVSTGEFYVSNTTKEELTNELTLIQPKEIIVPQGIFEVPEIAEVLQRYDCMVSERNLAEYTSEESGTDIYRFENQSAFTEYFDSITGVTKNAAMGLLGYLNEIFPSTIPSFRNVKSSPSSKVMKIDLNTFQALEITQTFRDRNKKGSLLSVLKIAKTPGGKRLLRTRLRAPSVDLEEIQRRHALISIFHGNMLAAEILSDHLKKVKDIERVLQKINTNKAGPGDVQELFSGLRQGMEINNILSSITCAATESIHLSDFKRQFEFKIADVLQKYEALFDGTQNLESGKLTVAGSIAAGFSAELDKFQDHRNILTSKIEKRTAELSNLLRIHDLIKR